MSPTLKRILLISGIILLAILIAFGLYFAFKKTATYYGGGGTAPSAPTTGQLPTAGERVPGAGVTETGGAAATLPGAQVVPISGEGNYYRPEVVTQLTADYAAYPSLNNSGGYRYHNAGDGKFYKLNEDGSARALSGQTFYNVQNVTWAKNNDKAVLEYPDGAKIIYNFETQKQVTLPKHWEEFSFSPDGKEVAAKSLGLAPENRWLITVNDDGTGTKLVEPMGENANKVIMDWSPSRQVVAFSQTGEPMGADRREELLIGLNGENFKSIVVEGLDFEPQWSKTGQKLIYSVDSARSDFKPELWIVDAYGDNIGNNRRLLGLNTWADKCAFADDNTAYCAAPRELPLGAGMNKDTARDSYYDLYKVNLNNGQKTNIPLKDDYAINTVAFDKNKILFTDYNKTGVFQIKL